jgi:DNA-binding NarL/FixJ family response regulator
VKTYAGDVQILRALKAGAQAYLLKITLQKELLQSLRGVLSSTCRLHGAELYVLSDDGESMN